MKKIFILVLVLLECSVQHSLGQKKCAAAAIKAELVTRAPAWEQRIEDQRNSLQGIADAYKLSMSGDVRSKTTTTSAIPVIFHILITYSKYVTMGGSTGIADRVDSQMAVLNRDFNALNADQSLIPSGWLAIVGDAGIHFGLAHTNPLGYGTQGYEIILLPDSIGDMASANAFSMAKHASSGGVDSWDVSKYLNVWCVSPDIDGLLGATISKSFTTGSGYPANEVGICINWAALGKRVTGSDYYIPAATAGNYYDQGRTLTHEMGHFFEIWHTWGDDNENCPWSGTHKDDGLADTPPEGGPKFKTDAYTIAGGTYFDTCRYDGAVDTQGILKGVPCLDFMNYTDDVGLYMFTADQAAVMASMVSVTGENYTLTQSADLLLWSVKTAVPRLEPSNSLGIYPNPTHGKVSLTFNLNDGELRSISIVDVIGRGIAESNVSAIAKDYYSIDLSAMSKGVYFIKCNFASGEIVRKILLQ
jgi:hypothetical protein